MVLLLPVVLATISIPPAVTQRLPRNNSKARAIQHHGTSSLLTESAADAHKVSAQVKSEIPGREKEAEKKGEALAQQAGQKFDRAVISPYTVKS